MDSSSREGFLSKAKWILSSLSGIITLWASRLPSPMQIPKHCHCRLQNLYHPSLIINSHMISSPSPSPSSLPSSPTSSLFRSLINSSSWCSAIDDFLGSESGVYMNSDYEQEMMGLLSEKSEAAYNRYHAKRSQRCSTMMKENPPPLPHMPRALTRHYENGNLVLKYEEMQQYFETTRENGRLILNMVQLKDNRIARGDGVGEKNNEELELEQKLEGTDPIKEERVDSIEYQETKADDGVQYEATHFEGSIMILTASQKMPKWCVEEIEDEEERCEELPKCFTYTGTRSTECVMNFGQLLPGSSPLAVTSRRVTPVM